ncbi:NAD-dependent epimerase/dehydratase family protein [Candidatus Poribacteria bacterium]|nr:NAD-dependent epimerase/dehydratase family protein [Candidatus Poribacteria bacterium]
MKVLVTGGAGFIGSHTVDLLLEKGYEVRIMDNLQKRVHPRGKPSYIPKEAEFMMGDVSIKDHLDKALKGVDAVFHLAAYQDYMPDFSKFINVNTQSTALMFELILKNKYPIKKIVFASSQSVSGEGKYECKEHGFIYPGPRPLEQLKKAQWEIKCPECGQDLKPLLIDEETSNPHTAYGISKYAIELLAFNLGKRYGIPTAAMRYTYVQGPRNSFYNAYSGICRIFALRLMNGLPLVAFEDGMQLRDYVNVKDVARANVMALEKDEANFQALNVGGGRAITVLDFAKIMLEKFNQQNNTNIDESKGILVPGEFRLGDTRHTFSDISRMKKLGWEPEIPVEKNVEQYLEWIKDQTETEEYFKEAEKIMKQSNIIIKTGGAS